MSCVFCAIVAGEVPSSRVYEDDVIVAFMDLHPVTPGHLLVIPRSVGMPWGMCTTTARWVPG